MGSPCPTSRTGTRDVPDSCGRMLLARAEGWRSRHARCCRSKPCCLRRRSRRAGCPTSPLGSSPPHLLGKGDAGHWEKRAKREIDAERMWTGGKRRGFAELDCILSNCNWCIPRFDHRSQPLAGPGSKTSIPWNWKI